MTLPLDPLCRGARWVLSHNGLPWHGDPMQGTGIPCPECNTTVPPAPVRPTCLNCVDEATFLSTYPVDEPDIQLALMEASLGELDFEPVDVTDVTKLSHTELIAERDRLIDAMKELNEWPLPRTRAGRDLASQQSAATAEMKSRRLL